MATRALFDLKNTTIITRNVASGQTATEGYLAIHSGADDEVDDGGASSDLGIGVFLDTVSSSATDRAARIALLDGGIIPVKVGTGGATRGKKAKMVSDGFTDATAHDSDGTGNESTYGYFMQSGVAGDFVGMVPAVANRGV